MNYIRFGSIFESGYGSQASSFSWGFFLRDWFDYLFSMQRGILPFNPILLISSLGWFFLPKENRKFFFLIGSIALSWFILMCFWKSFQGGYCWGNRLLIPILPLLVLPLAFVSLDRKLAKLALMIAAVFSSVIQISSVCTKTHEVSVLRNEIYSQNKHAPPPQLPSTVRLFWHKLSNNSTVVPASALGVSSHESFDFSSYESFHGFNLWAVHGLKFLYMTSTYFVLLFCMGLTSFDHRNSNLIELSLSAFFQKPKSIMTTNAHFTDHASLYDVEHFDSTRALYSRLALPYVPRILHLMDQNPYSPNYGCFDRAFWHYRTMDFPCGMSQEMVLLLALVYKNSYPGNSFHQVCRIKELSEAAIKFLIKSSHKDGTCDDYFPFERAMGALVFSLYAASESYLVLEMEDQENC